MEYICTKATLTLRGEPLNTVWIVHPNNTLYFPSVRDFVVKMGYPVMGWGRQFQVTRCDLPVIPYSDPKDFRKALLKADFLPLEPRPFQWYRTEFLEIPYANRDLYDL